MILFMLFASVVTVINISLIYISLSDNIRLVKTIDKKLQEYQQLKNSIPPIIPSPELLKKANDFDAYFQEIAKTLRDTDSHLVLNKNED